MGNQGTTNWKFIAFFVIGLMLTAGLMVGLLTSTAVARDGSGTASVTWATDPVGSALAPTFRSSNQLYDTFTDGERNYQAPLPANSTENQLRLSYRAETNMAGGEVEFSLPAGWTITKDLGDDITDVTTDAFSRFATTLLVTVSERFADTGDADASFSINREGIAVQADGTAFPDPIPDDQAAVLAAKALSGRVTVSGSSVLVNLSNDWRAGGEVVVVLRNVTTANPRSLSERPAAGAPFHSYPVTVKSKRTGRLDLLDPILIDHDGVDTTPEEYTTQPIVRVGNILGNRTGDQDTTRDGVQFYGADQVGRDFTITPDTVYEGETDETFSVTYTAKGPMYSIKDADGDITQQASIAITIPAELQATDAPLSAQNVSVIARGRVLPSGNLSVGAADTEVLIAGNVATINIDRIDQGATITLTYHLRGQDDNNDGEPDEDSLITVPTAPPGDDSTVSAFTIETSVPTAAATGLTTQPATSIAGGKIHPEEGSGTMTMTAPSDNQVEAGERIPAITLQYRAATVLMGATLAVDVTGIVLTDDLDTADVTETLGHTTYGQVSFRPLTFTPTGTIIGAVDSTSGADVVTLTFGELDFTQAGQTFTIDIKNVRAQDTGGAVTFTTRISGSGAALATDGSDDLASSPKLYITDTEDGAVEFKINDQSFETFSAGEERDSIVFSFEAISTAIKDGQVRFTLPSGWTPMKPPSADNAAGALGRVEIGGDGGFLLAASDTKPKTPISISSRTATVGVPNLAIGGKVTITIHKQKVGTDGIENKVKAQANATEADKPETVDGFFWTSGSRGRGYSAGKVEIEVTNADDGYGNATIGPPEVSAGSTNQEMTIDFTAVGTMDGGAVRLVIPDGWGNLQDDDATLANYVEVDVVRGRGSATANVADRAVIANLTGVESGSVVRFSYGGGTVASQNGAEVQASITTSDAPAAFIIESDGDGNGSFSDVRGEQLTAAAVKENTDNKTKTLGKVARDAYDVTTDPPPAGIGLLRVAVTGADDGSGTAEVEIVATGSDEGMYPDDDDSDGDGNRAEVLDGLMRIHAGDMGTYLKFTYTPTQTIQAGQLKFQTHGEWSAPFNSPGTPGYTEFHETGAANIGHIEFDESDNSVTVDIDSIDPDSTIEIHYGAYTGSDDGSGAHAPTAMTTSSPFSISVKGGDATTNQLKPIRTAKNAPIAVRVYSQASGGGNVSASVSDNKGDVGAGGTDREVTVVYTAAGQISGGSLKLTVPAGWSNPMMDTVAITSTGTVNVASALYGGAYVGDPDVTTDDTFPEDADGVALLGARDVTVGDVSLSAGGTVTFVYSAAMVQPGVGNASFGVAVDGGSGPGEGTAGVTPDPADATTIAVGDASPGSGSGMLGPLAQAVTIGSEGNTLTLIYTPSGAITDRTLDIRVDVPTGWSAPTDRIDAEARGSFTVTHKKLGADDTLALQTAAAAAVEKIGPFDRQMAARLKNDGSSLAAGDQVVFTYENADAPAVVGASTFTMFYGAVQVTDADLTVIVGSGKPATALAVTAPASHLVESETGAMVSIMLQDEDGNEVPAEADTAVSLSSSSAGGSFMVDGAAATMVSIMAGESTAMAYYSDTTEGMAIITASSGTLTAGTATINVTTDDVMITSATSAIADSEGVAKTVARDGDTITVTAMANPGKTVTVTIGTIVVNGNMMESATSPGTYTRSHTLAMGTADGAYAITVQIGGATDPPASAGSVTVDNTAPIVSAASALPAVVANGDTVTISATVSGATAVMANVSMLDIGAASVALADADADGTYTGMHTISADNTAANGAQLITVTAMDDAGNSADATATVTLQNSISFTSTLAQGISLFHVPLDEEGLDTVGDLETKLGDSVNLLITYDGTSWNSRSSAVAITASLGILVSMSAETTVTFEGQPWADTTIAVSAGSNLIGLPVNDPSVATASQIAGLFATGTISSVIVASGGSFQAATAADDVAVAGDAAYLVIATAAGSATLAGDGWQNGAAGAAPIALAGYTVDNQTPALNVHGSVVDEITGLAKEGFRVKVKNLSTKAALSEITAVEAAEGYNMTFVDLSDSHAARVGDVLEISADSPSPLIGVQPVRHIVTVDDVKNSTIGLESLIAYEIPAETELLRNYPNPFNPETWIPYHLAEDADVKLTIYNVSGEVVRDIDVGHQTAAKYDTRSKAIYWDGRNQFGEQVASGIYFYSLSAGDFSATRKMVILK